MVLDAHGGLDRWHDIGTLTVHARVGGELWGRRGQEGILPTSASTSTRAPSG